MSDVEMVVTDGQDQPGFASVTRIGQILAHMLGALGVAGEFSISNMGDSAIAFIVTTPWGQFAIFDNEHDDHWSAGMMVGDQIRRVPACGALHDVIRLHLLLVLDTTIMKATAYLDGLPPPREMH
jgi:hypothetical protein